MNEVVVDQELLTRLHGLEKQTAFRDETGKELGLFLPIETYRAMLAHLEIPFSEEEIARRRPQKCGASLAEFWKRMESA